MRYAIVAMLTVFVLAHPASSIGEVRGEEVVYQGGGVTMKGYLAWDEGTKDKRPGVLVVHEWWGHNDYARKRASMLAELGYTALAVDMYGNGKQASHPEDAGKFAGEVMKNTAAAQERFDAALALLKDHPTVDGARTAAIGYCFGGAVVLHMARLGEDIDGVVSFHGSLATGTPAKPGTVKARVLVFNGADDPFVKPEQIEAFKKEMEAAGVDFKFVSMAGAKHSFTNPEADTFGQKFNLPLAYDKSADEQSWMEMQSFFKQIFAE